MTVTPARDTNDALEVLRVGTCAACCASAASGAARGPPAKVPRNARQSIMGSGTPTRSSLRGQSSGHFPPAPPEPAPKPVEQASHLAWPSWNAAGFLRRRNPPG